MLTIMKNDYKLLLWSQTVKRTMIIAGIIMLSNFILLSMTIMGGTGTAMEHGVGFIFKHYSQDPTFEEVLIASLANTIYFWIIVFMMITSFVTKDIIEKRQINAIANKISLFTLSISKMLVASMYIIGVYALTMLVSILINSVISNVTITGVDILKALGAIGLNGVAFVSFVWICSSISILFNSTQYTHLFSFLFFFAGAFYELMNVAKHQTSYISECISNSNPFVYTMYFSAYNLEGKILPLFVFSLITIGISLYILKQKVEKRDYI